MVQIKQFFEKEKIIGIALLMQYATSFLPKVKIEVAITDDLLDSVIEAIINSAKTDKIGDGKIFVSNLEQAIRIRTGESGEDAL